MSTVMLPALWAIQTLMSPTFPKVTLPSLVYWLESLTIKLTNYLCISIKKIRHHRHVLSTHPPQSSIISVKACVFKSIRCVWWESRLRIKSGENVSSPLTSHLAVVNYSALCTQNIAFGNGCPKSVLIYTNLQLILPYDDRWLLSSMNTAWRLVSITNGVCLCDLSIKWGIRLYLQRDILHTTMTSL